MRAANIKPPRVANVLATPLFNPMFNFGYLYVIFFCNSQITKKKDIITPGEAIVIWLFGVVFDHFDQIN